MTCFVWLVLAGCRIGGETALAPDFAGGGFASDHSPIVVGEGHDAGADATVPPTSASSDKSAQHDAGPFAPADAGVMLEEDAGDACATACAPVPADCAEHAFASHSYLFCTTTATWSDARTRCRAQGLDLVVIDDAQENQFVAAQLQATSWIGANDLGQQGKWTWIVPGTEQQSGAALAYTDWAFAAPDNCAGLGGQDCARIASDGTWNDSACSGGCLEGTFGFVCESF